jgi:phage recombination protein Bet
MTKIINNNDLKTINDEINTQLSDVSVKKTLIATTFKGLDETNMKKAIFEAMIRGFVFKDFLDKNVYALPFKDGYSLITSIDYARKKAMKNGLAGKNKPEYVFDDNGGIISCSVTVKRNANGFIGEYTSEIYFKEYNTGYNLWKSKPLTMIAKVAEMHALRSAFPEDLSQAYVEEEMEAERIKFEPEPESKEAERREKIAELLEQAEQIKTKEELRSFYQLNKGYGKDFDAKMIELSKNLK